MGDLKRRLDETGNVELKGETQEQLIEEFLREKFSHFGDTVEPIKKGQSGADNILNIFYKEKNNSFIPYSIKMGNIYLDIAYCRLYFTLFL